MDDHDVEIDASELVEVLDGFEDRLKNLPMELYSALFISKVDEMFQTEGTSGTDGRWEPLSPNTLKRHPRRKGGMLLQDTGAMAAGVIHSETEGHTMTFETSANYGRWHLGGTEHMPKRDFFAINYPKFLDELGDLVLEETQT